MPHKDPEERKKANREAAQRRRDRQSGKTPTPTAEPARTPSLGLAPLVSAKDLNLSDLAAKVMAETDNLSSDGWLNLQGAMGLEVLAIVRSSLRATLQVRTVKDLVALMKLGQALIEPVIAARGKLGGEEGIPSDMQEAHAKMMALPGGIEHANAMVQLLSQALLMGGK